MPKVEEGVVVAGRFRLGTKLGQGGMGSVWRATQLGLDSQCAVKFLDGELGSHPEMLGRFEREAKSAAALRSPHVVAIIDHALWEGIPFIAMELLDGENLGDRIARVGRLGVADTLRILGEVCRALTKAHQLGIVHRDLKPDNIFIVKDDDREITKVLDFGIAKTSGLETSSNTRTGAMLGTPYYMSPEQAQGTRAVDYRADLWSMAVIAYQCLTGRLPFESEALGDLLMKLMIAPIPVPSEVAPVPPGFDTWWVKAASREPSQRFGSAKEFIDALGLALGVSSQAFGDGLSMTAPMPNMPGAPRQQTGPNLGKGTQLIANTPQPLYGTPHPQASPVAAPLGRTGGHGELANTPAPIAQTFSGASAPKKGFPMAVVGAIGGGAVLLAAAALILTRVLAGHAATGHDGVVASSPPASRSVPAVSAEPPVPPPSAAETKTAAETASTPPAPSDSAPPAPSVAVTASGAAPSVGPGAGHATGPKAQPATSRGGAATAEKPKPGPGATPAASAARRDFGF